MRFVEFSFGDPAGNLAVDEVLLERVAAGTVPDTFRLWESRHVCIVIGSSQVLRDVVIESHCTADGIKIFRRCSAGGAVVQGPGCLNYTLALSYVRYPKVAQLQESYQYILNRVRAALLRLGIRAVHQGTSDLTWHGRKFSGNAQRRKKTACLHHGTLLYQAPVEAMARYLAEPKDRPEYRGTRTHQEFIIGLPVQSEQLQKALMDEFCPGASAEPLSLEEREYATQLVKEKYNNPVWTYRR